ncbi:tRNA uridine-5-carboxymethylaminomethyl(34) synthesis GTPase MnmE [Microvirga sp. STS02]|uniref:tRNA uridine-5-carboxymethylaminomethyl(34) synthesis GTPase MnmE n=1 Tax=Hymenobacter negativus TaxID=2795026 RepID=UPI0018DBFF1E|nr:MULTISPECIES: tRNA uridine-5-carboxymethylaminomethyl(34) synthesis GTPase MnmE [Bacteria]MBH8569209.1 tRNA uridine-5-carboxymethylaminomethyl(34) synthesis GTPase MnmE [Hymenobacter negativus]MBR7208944.1 tRNA uridine-5-carboxymethylaminomethyl(34) synthesis GTPase MnmE [Microvirga sp. STS02]
MVQTIFSDTIVALSTPPGAGALAVVRLSGPAAVAITASVFSKKSFAEATGNTLHYGTLRDPNAGEILDEVVVGLFRAPKSFTREDVVEISCHGSDYVVRQVLALLLRQGARLAEAGEFTKRAFLSGAMDLAQAEAVADLIAADSALSHKVALNQLRGGFSQELRDLRARLIKFAALLELELDFGEEDVEFADRTGLAGLLAEVRGVVLGLLRSFELGNVIKNGITTVIAGRPNAGKSTLLNALLREERAIVSAIPGTTRDFIEDEVSIDGLRFRFVDTAGLRDDTADEVEAIGVARTRERVRKASLLLYLFDLAEMTPTEVRTEIKALTAGLKLPVLAVGNKTDLASTGALDAFGAEFRANLTGEASGIPLVLLAAGQNQGLEALQTALVKQVRGSALENNASATIVTNVRHARALETATAHLAAVQTGLDTGFGTELLAADLRHALAALGEITGEISSEDLLTSIFTEFCIGK